jgi:hypothetical protein
MIEPDLKDSCIGEDSEFYMFSIPGYSPCNLINISGNKQIKLEVQCKYDTEKVLEEKIKTSYYDVTSFEIPPPFEYEHLDLVKNFALSKGKEFYVVFSIADMQWLTKRHETRVKATVKQITGQEPVEMGFDFNTIPASAVTSGRIFYEYYMEEIKSANESGFELMVGKGFLDVEGYKEPLKDYSLSTTSIILIVVAIIAFPTVVVIIYKKKQKEKAEMENRYNEE